MSVIAFKIWLYLQNERLLNSPKELISLIQIIKRKLDLLKKWPLATLKINTP